MSADENDLPDEDVVAMFEHGDRVELVDSREQLVRGRARLEQAPYLLQMRTAGVHGAVRYSPSLNSLRWTHGEGRAGGSRTEDSPLVQP